MLESSVAVLTIVGQFGGRAPITATGFGDLGAGITQCLNESWMIESDGFYLMGTAGENALAAALIA